MLLGYRAQVLLKTAMVACGLPLLLATASFCLESWPPSKSSFDPLSSVSGAIEVRILDSGWLGLRSCLYHIDVHQGRVVQLENKPVSSQEFEIPPHGARSPAARLTTTGPITFRVRRARPTTSPHSRPQTVATSCSHPGMTDIRRAAEVKSRSSSNSRLTVAKFLALQFRIAIMSRVSLGRRIQKEWRYYCLRSAPGSAPWICSALSPATRFTTNPSAS